MSLQFTRMQLGKRTNLPSTQNKGDRGATLIRLRLRGHCKCCCYCWRLRGGVTSVRMNVRMEEMNSFGPLASLGSIVASVIGSQVAL